MILRATLIRASLEAAIANGSFGPNGATFPDELFSIAGRHHGVANDSRRVGHLCDIAGGAVLITSSISRPRQSQVDALVRKSIQTVHGVDGEPACASFPRFAIAWRTPSVEASGGLFAERNVVWKHDDLDQPGERRSKRPVCIGASSVEG
ncbi:MAG: 4-hydroxyphenylacetate 3-hydroxylase C-terminal domain-containing protein [Acidobacteriota bacterium]